MSIDVLWREYGFRLEHAHFQFILFSHYRGLGLTSHQKAFEYYELVAWDGLMHAIRAIEAYEVNL